MSIQDESFPHDTLLDDLHFLTNNSKHFVFPNQIREKRERSNPPAMSTNTSDSEQNISSETSTNGGRPLSELSVKTSASDPLGLMQEDDGKTLGLATQNSSKAASYQDIHSEYTKRRYKHVESKVGQYIASIRADDQRRRSAVRFQRHRSMPDTLSGVSVGAGAQKIPLTATETAVQTVAATQSRNTNLSSHYRPMHKTIDESNSDPEADSSGNTNSSGNTMGTASTSASATSRSGHSHESSGDAANGADLNEKSAYAQLVHEKESIQSYNDYLQARLDEKMGETMRLKRNVDFLRIELSNCKDKLKKQHPFATSASASSNGLNCFNSDPTLTSSLGRHSLQSLVYCQVKSTKSTQTDLLTPPPPQLPPPLLRARDIYITPDTPDANNNTFGDSSDKAVIPCATSSINCLPIANIKSVATIQPLSLNFSNNVEDTTCSSSENSNNNGNMQQNSSDNSVSSNVASNVLRTDSHSFRSCSKSTIDIETLELDAIKPTQRNGSWHALQSSSRARQQLKSYDSEEIILYEQVPSRCHNSISADALDCSPEQDESQNIKNNRLQRKPKLFTSRRRWLRLLGPCVHCEEPNHNQSLNNSNGSNFPLLQ